MTTGELITYQTEATCKDYLQVRSEGCRLVALPESSVVKETLIPAVDGKQAEAIAADQDDIAVLEVMAKELGQKTGGGDGHS